VSGECVLELSRPLLQKELNRANPQKKLSRPNRRATTGPTGPSDRTATGPRAEGTAHGPPGHRAGPPVAHKVRTGPAQVMDRFDGPLTGPRITGQMANYSLTKIVEVSACISPNISSIAPSFCAACSIFA
jgi:hypothetical protein